MGVSSAHVPGSTASTISHLHSPSAPACGCVGGAGWGGSWRQDGLRENWNDVDIRMIVPSENKYFSLEVNLVFLSMFLYLCNLLLLLLCRKASEQIINRTQCCGFI